tara:strand:- start:663 stop:1229 length:567 start_codon:yes stop_codon:yes gene_type:complete
VKIKDRIKGFQRLPSSELRPHPKNWRQHPDAQVNSFKNVLASIGVAGACIVYEPSDGDGYMLIDGHLRADQLDDVPCLLLDVTDEEAEQLLASYDTLTYLADVDKDKVGELIDSVPELNDDLLGQLQILAGEWDTDMKTGEELIDTDGLTDEGIMATIKVVVLQEQKEDATGCIAQALHDAGMEFIVE